MALYSPRHSRPLPSAARAAAVATAADHPPTGTPAPTLPAEPVESVFSIVKRARITPFAPVPAPSLTAQDAPPVAEAAGVSPAAPKPKSKAANLRRAAKSSTAARARRARLATTGAAGPEAAHATFPVHEPAAARTAGDTPPASVETTGVIESLSAAVVPRPALVRRSIFDDVDHRDEDDDEPRRVVWLRPRALAGAAAAAMIVVALGATSLAEDGAPAAGHTAGAANPHGAVSLPANVVNDSHRIPAGSRGTVVRQNHSGQGGITNGTGGNGAVAGSTATTAGAVTSRPPGSSVGGHSTAQSSAGQASTPAGPTTSASRTHSHPPTSSKPKPPPPSETCFINILGIKVCLPI